MFPKFNNGIKSVYLFTQNNAFLCLLVSCQKPYGCPAVQEMHPSGVFVFPSLLWWAGADQFSVRHEKHLIQPQREGEMVRKADMLYSVSGLHPSSSRPQLGRLHMDEINIEQLSSNSGRGERTRTHTHRERRHRNILGEAQTCSSSVGSFSVFVAAMKADISPVCSTVR